MKMMVGDMEAPPNVSDIQISVLEEYSNLLFKYAQDSTRFNSIVNEAADVISEKVMDDTVDLFARWSSLKIASILYNCHKALSVTDEGQ